MVVEVGEACSTVGVFASAGGGAPLKNGDFSLVAKLDFKAADW
jgi:hypothetical protein